MEDGMKRMLRSLMMAFLASCVISTVWAGGGSQASEPAPAAGTEKLLQAPITFRVAFAENADTPIVKHLSEAYNKASQLTNGEIKFEIFPSGQLGTIPDVTEQMNAGAPIIINTGFDNVAELVPELGVAAAPYAFLDIKEVFKLVKTPWFDNISRLMNEKAGMQPIGVGASGYRHFISRKPIRDASSIKGMKIRMGPSALAQTYIRLMGGTPVTSNWVDNYPSIQQGVFDSCEAALSLLYSSSLYEVAKYLTLSGHFVTPAMQVTSASSWAKVPEAYQKIIKDCVDAGMLACYEEIVKSEEPLIQQFKDKGVEVIVTDKSTFAAYTPQLLMELGYPSNAYDEFRKAIDSAPKN
jgi:TRAP-type C4-dicarboxylate transport system substrate-binding protein